MMHTTPFRLRQPSSREPVPSEHGFKDASETFGKRLAAEGRSPNTISAYLRDLSILLELQLRSHPNIAPGEVPRAMINESPTALEVATSAWRGVQSPASMHWLKAAVRSFFAWTEQNGIVRENPAATLNLRRLFRTPPKFLTEAERRPLLKELRSRSDLPSRRDRIIIELFLGTGIRLQELVGLDVDDVDLDPKHLCVLAKGGVPQVKFLKSALRSLLRRSLIERRRLGDGQCRALFLSNRGTRISPGQVANRVKHWKRSFCAY